jgi:Peptidase family M1 domain
MPSMASPSDRSPRETYDALNSLRIDPASTYQIEQTDRIELHRADLKLAFDEGKLAFFTAFDGRITGAVFSGRGHALALPHGVVEKQQMARFLGAPVLDQDFTYTAMRFTDGTADELLRQLASAKRQPQQDSDFAGRWNSLLEAANPVHSLRIAFDSLTKEPRPYFYATIGGIATGPFDAVLDLARYEPFLLGQPKKSANREFYDVWASYQIPGNVPMRPGFRALQYSIDTSLLADGPLDAKTDVRLRAQTAGERLLVFQLSRSLVVDGVTGDHGEKLVYFQNEGMNLQERNTRGNDYLYVALPTAPALGAEFTLHFHYGGNIIQNAGNGVFFVGARESWYPHLGDAADFSDYDLTMRWPRRLRLVATGAKTEEHEEGDFRIGHWRTERPVSVAGFNLGDYVSTSIASGNYSVDVFANRQLEQALDNRLESPAPTEPGAKLPNFGGEARNSPNMREIVPVAPRPSDALKQLAHEIDASIRFYETFSGPFPFQKLSVSQIPGTFGQGWPGLLYLSTYSYLPAEAQQRAGLSEASQEHFTELVPSHETAHQWWGNVVGWDSYRDQWIDEAISNYLALLFSDTQKGVRPLRVWLERYRKRLTEKLPGSASSAAEIGALDLGSRLTSSKSPFGFEDVIYGKGAWVIHMLRESLKQPGTKNPDARFAALLHTLATKYAYRALSTADLQREVEAVMTPAMDLEGGRSMEWFFEQWVRGTGIPHYKVEFNAHPGEKGFVVRGKLFQEQVPRSFVAPVPLYAVVSGGRPTFLGIVIAGAPETSFHFTTTVEPHKIVIDPQMTLLCVTQ